MASVTAQSPVIHGFTKLKPSVSGKPSMNLKEKYCETVKKSLLRIYVKLVRFQASGNSMLYPLSLPP
jgi:hypothetical protein